jgi:hypothetical protein
MILIKNLKIRRELTLLLLDTILVRLGIRDLEPLAVESIDEPVSKFLPS